MKKKLKIVLLTIVMSSFAIFSTGVSESYFEIAKNLDIFNSLYKELNSLYVDDTDPGELMKESIDHMLESLDPYTTYIPESEIEDFRFMTTGQYGGIGAVITKRDEHVYISEPYEGFAWAIWLHEYLIDDLEIFIIFILSSRFLICFAFCSNSTTNSLFFLSKIIFSFLIEIYFSISKAIFFSILLIKSSTKNNIYKLKYFIIIIEIFDTIFAKHFN